MFIAKAWSALGLKVNKLWNYKRLELNKTKTKDQRPKPQALRLRPLPYPVPVRIRPESHAPFLRPVDASARAGGG